MFGPASSFAAHAWEVTFMQHEDPQPNHLAALAFTLDQS